MVYAIHIPGFVIFKFCQLSNKQWMLEQVELHVHSIKFEDTYAFIPKIHVLLQDRIYQVYTRYIPGIYLVYTMRKSLASLLSRPSALGSIRPGLPSDLLSFGHREAAHARLGPSKVPQPGVDLVNMAAPPRVRARTIGTAALKSVPLPAAVLVWNSGGCISVQKAWNERNLNPSDVKSGNR
jgi:hypothetical protein